MAIIKNISKLVVPAYNKGPKDVVDYINAQAWLPTSTDVGLIENPGDFGSYVGTNQIFGEPYLQATILATTLAIPVEGGVSTPLGNWSGAGYAFIGSEVFYYSAIAPASSSVSGYDEFTVASTADRGVLGTTATGHTAAGTATFAQILIGATTKIEYNKPLGVFNVWTKTTEQMDISFSYGAQGWTYVYNTYLVPCPEDVVTFFETSPGVN